MDASQTSDLILSIIKKSNLNFSLSESPFSVTIQVKKTFIRDRDGSIRSSGIDENSNYCHNSQNSHENLYKDQQHNHDVHGDPHLSKALQLQLVHATHHLDEDQVLPQHKGPVVPTSLLLTQQHQTQIQKTAHAHSLLPNNEPIQYHAQAPTHPQVQKPPLHHAFDQTHLLGIEQDHQAVVHVPNIQVRNQFSCLAHVLSDDNISNSLGMSFNNNTREVNNNTGNDKHCMVKWDRKPIEKDDVVIVDKDEIEYLEVNNKRLKQATGRLNRELARVREDSKKDKSDAVKDIKTEIKKWRKSLGLERSEKVKLEKKLVLFKKSSSEASSSSKPTQTEKLPEEVASDATCSICVRPIPNYVPRYSNGLLWNPACSDCDDPSDTDENDETPG
jgi:hypothetical protein